ncbi:hypothetical protein BH11ACT8_BH11ACT8_16250 [soil metagenome]
MYALVPSARRARLLVPLAPGQAAASAMCRFSAASTSRDVLTRLAVAGLTRSTAGLLLRDQVVMGVGGSARQESLRQHLGQVLNEPVSVSMGVGPARVNRKPVLQVFDRRGRTVAFAKVGDSAQAASDVRSETVALRRLEGRPLGCLSVPRVLDASPWNGMEVLLMSPLRARARLGRPTDERAPLQAMADLVEAFEEPALPVGELAWWERQCATVDEVADPELRSSLQHCLRVVLGRHGWATVPVGAWHGDWTPWNMARSGARVLVWDWERFETGVPTGLDVWHYRVNAATRQRGLRADVVLDALARGGGDEGGSAMLADLYLVAIAVRYAGLLSAARGADVAPSAQVMVTALETRTRSDP